ncbi:MAG: PDZ domain-containing protein, partial [Nitrospirae bacterium]|nr:PDZ domain-containing protein [Nitrospirota bacterium]
MPPVEIEKVLKNSIAERAGILASDAIAAINGNEVRDVIDALFYGAEPEMELLIKRGDVQIRLKVKTKRGIHDLGIELKPFRVKTCRNNCIFCFVSQLPRGLRQSLYVKDEDYRMSFLYGNYVTLANLSEQDKKRIIRQRLSPLYISVHSTDMGIRNNLLGNPKANDIMREMRFLADNKIKMHTQIVLCPGYNDGRQLEKTISDLYKLHPYVMSIAVVPVGLTEHRRKPLKPVESGDALKAISTVQRFQSRFRKRH